MQVEKEVPLTEAELEAQEKERAEKAAAKAEKEDEDVSDEGEHQACIRAGSPDSKALCCFLSVYS